MIKNFFRYHKRHSSIKNPGTRFDRLKLLCCIFIVCTSLIIAKLAYVQIWQHKGFSALASENHDIFKNLFPTRGEIYVADPYSEDNQYKIAVNQDLSIVYADPWRVDARQEQPLKELALLLNLTDEELKAKLEQKKTSDGRKDTFEVLKRKISLPEKQAIKDLNIKGINFAEEVWRYYPSTEYTAHLIGFVGIQDDKKKGQYGLEGFYENELAGTPGFLRSAKDTTLNLHKDKENEVFTEAQDGYNLYLTIDKNIQFYACDKLKTKVQSLKAKQGVVIVIQPRTGAIIASCSYPSYDPNNYNEVEDMQIYVDKAIAGQYEPGSVFKTLSLGAAIDMNKISPYTTYNDKGYVKVGVETIYNSDKKSHGIVDMNYVLENSLNTGSTFAVQQIGDEAWYQYVTRLGFGKKTGIDLEGEVNGNLLNLEELRDIYSANSSFGQGIAVTPIQLITAYASIANNGKVMKPYVVAAKEDANGVTEVTQPEVIRQVFSPQTSQTLLAMLVNVVDYGHSQPAHIDGYYVGGKTGTAQIPLENGGGYDATRHNDTYIGIGPISDPQFVMLTRIDEPQEAAWAESSAAPLWAEIAKYILDYYQIPPDRK